MCPFSSPRIYSQLKISGLLGWVHKAPYPFIKSFSAVSGEGDGIFFGDIASAKLPMLC